MISNYLLDLRYQFLISRFNFIKLYNTLFHTAREIILIFRLSQWADFTGRIKESRESSLRIRVITGSERAGDSTEESSRERN